MKQHSGTTVISTHIHTWRLRVIRLGETVNSFVVGTGALGSRLPHRHQTDSWDGTNYRDYGIAPEWATMASHWQRSCVCVCVCVCVRACVPICLDAISLAIRDRCEFVRARGHIDKMNCNEWLAKLVQWAIMRLLCMCVCVCVCVVQVPQTDTIDHTRMTAPPTTNRVESYRHLPNAEWPQLPIIRSLWHRIESNRNELDKQQPTKRLVTAKGGKLSVEENNGQYEGGVTSFSFYCTENHFNSWY